jgi:hypothetical protein
MAEINISNLGGGGGTLTLTTTGTGGASTYVAGVLNIPVYQGQLTLTTSGTSGAATLVGDTLNIPQYQGAITLTTTGTSGASTLVGNTLNIPNYLSSSAPAGITGEVQFNNSGNFAASSNLFWDNAALPGGQRLGVGTSAPASSVHIVGAGATSGTTSFLVQNNGPTDLLRIDNSGVLTIGASSSLSSVGASQITSSSSLTNSNIVLTPKGTGAITVGSAPDGTITGGSARGANAIDLQFTRATSSTIVASGDRSALIGGNNNLASAQFSFVGGGGSNSSTGTNAAILGGAINTASAENSSAFGRRALANLYGSQAFSTFGFAVAGDGMTLRFSVQREITGTAASELTLTGAAPASTTRAILVSNRLWNVNLQVSAICSTAGNGTLTLGDSYVATYQVGIKRLVNTTTLVGTPQLISTQSDTGMSTSAVTISADDATGNESLKVEFTPPTATAGSTTVIRVIVAATATVVGY